MNLRIGKYKITSDPMNVILSVSYEKKDKHGNLTGDTDFRPIGYFKDLESACNRILNTEILGGHADTVEELKELIEQTKKAIVSAIEDNVK
ncbi:hypothetical protein P9D57_17745 [Bacillus sonorensis]|uniref:hypothetical protein n=1 Tax=Bacillus sonorensis TaxID=119858 RepID=UPI002DBC650F|nr:hypothetical protein [Bacillus sonorensis]MEC1440535.1 hypothetical protein [Bacillus sonorensis]